MKFFQIPNITLLMVTLISVFLTPTVSAENIARETKDPPKEIKTMVNSEELAVKPRKSARLWNLQDADILSVINEVSQETGKNFVVDPRISGKITLISSKALRHQEVYQVFLTVLGMLGYAAIPSGDVIKIVPNMESGEQATKVANNRFPGKGEEVIVRVIPLENVTSTQLIPVIRPLLPQWSNISAYSPGNVLILLGRADNLKRIIKIIHDVDKAANSSIQIVPLHYASAGQVAAVLNNLQNAARMSGESPVVSVAVDERSNSILLGGPKSLRLRLRVLIAQLDQPSSNSGNTEVIYLRYQEAKKFGPILAKIAQNIIGKDTGAGGSSYSMNAMSSMALPGGMGSSSSKESSAAPNPSSIIQFEPNSNALIITAPPTLMLALKSVIAKLDIRPAQVLVEAIIAQIDESNLRSLGIQWGSVGRGGQIIPTSGAATDFPSLGAGIIGILPHTDLRIVLSILENQNGVDILSTPQIVVLDNQKATIEVGKDVAEQTGSYITPTGVSATTAPPFNTIGRKKVTLKLDVTPQINLGTSVRLTLDLKNDTLQNPDSKDLNPLINTSEIKNAVLVKNNDILVLGGLISNTTNENINKIPILGDIPGIGILFQQKTRKLEKKNLMVFIKPVIMHDEDISNSITHTKYNQVRRAEANFKEDLANLPKDNKLTLLPPWKNTKDLPTPFAPTPKQCPNGTC